MRRLLVTILFALLLVSAAAAFAATPLNQQRLDRTVRFLQEAQNPDGGFGGEPGEASLQGISAWVALALAAAGINPQDQRKPGGTDVYSFLVGHFSQGVEDETCHPEICTTALERELMVANASGTSPHAFGSVDLVSELLARQRDDDGSFAFVPGGVPAVNTTVFAILGLAPVAEPEAQTAIVLAADWLEGAQQGNGGWSWGPGSPDEVDMTGAAIQALVVAGRAGSPAIAAGIEYLHGAQNLDGCFPEIPGDPESNVASTAWATQAIWAVGQNPEDWRTHGGGPSEEPLDCMGLLQEPDGHLRWKRSQDLNGIWMTAYAAPAFAGQVWPFRAPARALPPEAAPEGGEGGGGESGSGVIAGGGGNGAPLFSRPQPQSKGRTPGGARLVRNQDLKPADRSETRRGANSHQSRGSESSEPNDDGSRREPPPVVTGSAGTTADSSGGASSSNGASGDRDSDAAAGGSGAASRRADTGATTAAAAGSSGPAGTPLAGVAAASLDTAAAQQVSGTVIGSAGGSEAAEGRIAFGAPGLHGAGVDEADGGVLAIGIGVLALLAALGGARWERRREAVL